MVSRRSFLGTVVAALSVGVAGCQSGSNETPTGSPTPVPTDSATRSAARTPTPTERETTTGTPSATPTETPTPEPETPSPTPTPRVQGSAEDVVFDEFVTAVDGHLSVGGERTYFNGGNHPQVARLDRGATPGQWLSEWAELVPSLNVMRVPAFGVGEESLLQPFAGIYNPDAFRYLDEVVYRFGASGIRLVMPLTNYWDWWGGIPRYVEESSTASTKGDFYTDDQCQEWYRDFVSKLLERENSITGVKYRNDPTIMAWELANEPRVGDAEYEDYRNWVVDSAEHVKSIDDNHLVSTGMEGFYSHDGMVGHSDTRYVKTHQVDPIDVCSFHLYPESWGISYDQGAKWIQKHTRDAHEKVGKPTIFGEFGVPITRGARDTDEKMKTRNETYQMWYQAMIDAGTDAGMVWDLRTDRHYTSTTWDSHAVYPRDDETVEVIETYTRQITGQ
ncbi:MAG: cellulase family glycosylhydrolase [Haloarculaceae archaeon]